MLGIMLAVVVSPALTAFPKIPLLAPFWAEVGGMVNAEYGAFVF